MASCILLSFLLALFFAVTRCRGHIDPRVTIGFNFNHKTVPDPFAVSAKNDDVKRPFGRIGGGIFSSSSRVSDSSRWKGGKRSLTPWAMSKIVVKQPDTTSHHATPQTDEEIYSTSMKLPFFPRIYTSPSAERVDLEKRPFGGTMIFSKPRDTGTKSRFGGYLMSRAQRRDSRGTAGTKLRETPVNRREKSPFSVFQTGFDESEQPAWWEEFGRSGEGRKQHRQMSPATYNDDYEDDDFGIINVRGKEVDDDVKEEEDDSSRVHRQ